MEAGADPARRRRARVATLAIAALYGRYSLQLTAANPLVWAVLMALMAAFVAYRRYPLGPLARA